MATRTSLSGAPNSSDLSILTSLSVALLCVFLGSLAPVSAHAQDGLSRILRPRNEATVRVSPGEMLPVTARMALPLTPPPGVQLEKIWANWAVVLTRRAMLSLDNGHSEIKHRARLVRISSEDGVRDYTLLVEVSSWTPEGLYDLSVVGPGFKWESPASVQVGRPDTLRSPIVEKISESSWRIQNSRTAPWSGTIELIVTGDSGVVIRDAKKRLVPLTGATFSECTEKCNAAEPRLLRFKAAFPQAESAEAASSIAITIERLQSSPKPSVSIALQSPDEPLIPVRAHSLKVVSSVRPLATLWDFQDGHTAVGSVATHRWTRSLTLGAIVHLFDDTGRVHSRKFSTPLEMPLSRGGCSCSSVGSPVPVDSLLKVLLFSCIER